LLMNRTYFFIVMGIGEGATGLLVLVAPPVLLALLLGIEHPSVETSFVSRIAGAALLAIGVACWLARHDQGHRAQFGLLTGAVVYDVAAAALLAYAGVVLNLVGLALWPAVALHVALTLWGILCFSVKPQAKGPA
jgi:hypothetical protein